LRPAVAGRPSSNPTLDVFSIVSSTYDPIVVAAAEAELMADFADFMNGEDELDSGLLPTPDPTFKERLRRRLWRTFLMSYLRGGDSTH